MSDLLDRLFPSRLVHRARRAYDLARIERQLAEVRASLARDSQPRECRHCLVSA